MWRVWGNNASKQVSVRLRTAKPTLSASRANSDVASSLPESGVPYKDTIKDREKEVGNVPSESDVVIIGGGSVGCSTLYHLTKRGCRATLLERARLTSGTTWHSAGLLWRLRPSDTEVVLLNKTRDLLQRLEDESGLNSGWIQNGGLFIASSKVRLQEYSRLHSLGRAMGVDSHLLSPAQTKELYPLLNVDKMVGTLYSPGDGTIDPASYCAALVRVAKNNGGLVVEECPVTSITTEEATYDTKRVTQVVTPKGTIKTKCVINCTGVWSPQVSALVGLKIPLLAMKHSYVVTNGMEGVAGKPNVRDHDSSIYLRLQGDALCIGGYENNPIFWDNVATDFAFSLFDLDWDVFGVHIENAVSLLPDLEKAGVKSTVCGPESFTPDHKPLLGEDPKVRGFFHGCGFNSAGLMLSGGCGDQLAEWALNGRPELDMFGYDIRRFHPKQTEHAHWVRERSHESYVKNYSIVFPHDESLAARNLRKDALHQELLSRGCVFQEKCGWERPGWFSDDCSAAPPVYDWYGAYDHTPNTDSKYVSALDKEYTFAFPEHHKKIGSECLTCRESAAIFNMSYFGQFYLTGPDAQEAANWIFTNNVSGCPGSTVYTCLLNRSGGVEADLTVSVLEPGAGGVLDPKFEGRGFYVAVGGGFSHHVWSHMVANLQDRNFNVNLSDQSEQLVLMSLQGPRSREILQEVANCELDNNNFPFSTQRLTTISGRPARLLRLSFVGELGWEVHAASQDAVPIYRALLNAAQKLEVPLKDAGYRAMDSLSAEKGYRHWHGDVRPDVTPLEAGLAFTCRLGENEPDFLGRSALLKRKQEGAKRRLAVFTLEEAIPLWGLEGIWKNGKPVGYLQRAEFAFALNKTIGYGYIKHPDGLNVTPDFIRSGKYEIDVMGKRHPAKVHLRSPFDPKNKRLQGDYSEPLPIRA